MADFIFNQHTIPSEILRYGLRSSAATGCGWIATYNALLTMGLYAPPEELISYYEHRLPLIHGNFGTTMLAPAEFFQRHGFRVMVVAQRKRFDHAARDADACIVFYRWRKGAKLGAHFVAIRYRSGAFFGYNTDRNSAAEDCYGESLSAFLEKRHFFGAVLIAIYKT